MNKYIEKYKSKKRNRYLRFMQTITDVGMYAAAAWFVCLFLCIVAPSYQAVKYGFVIISGLWISAFIFWIKASFYKISVSLIKSPKYIFVNQENELDFEVKIIKGPQNDWKMRVITNNHPNQKSDYLWLYKSNLKKWKNRWAIQNNIGFYEEELSPIAIADRFIDERISTKIKFFGRKRGMANISQVKFSRTDPLGWLQYNKIINIPNKKVFVIPSPKKITTWPSSRATSILLQEKEKYKRRVTPNGDEYIGVREANYSDSMKNTHWKLFAKTGKRWVIEKEDKFQSKLALVIDPVLIDENDKESFEVLLETISGQVLNTGKTSDINWIFIDSDPIGANGNNYNAWDRVMEKVALMEPVSESLSDKSWEKFMPHWKKIVALRIITTRSEKQLLKWITLWKKMNINVEIINVKRKENDEK